MSVMARSWHVTCRVSCRVIFFALMLMTGACTADNSGTVITAPTQTLMPARPTETLTPTITPSVTVTDQPRPQELALTATANVTPDATAQALTQAQPLIQLASADLASRTGAQPAEITFARQEIQRWQNANLECEPETPQETTTQTPDDPVEGYSLLFIVEDVVYEYHTDTAGTVKLCLESSLYDDYPELLLERDPVAAELADLAQQRLGRDLDFPVRRIRVSSIHPVEWMDSSLGCPVEGQFYMPVTTRGYRIVLTVNETDYTYHSDFERVIACNTAS